MKYADDFESFFSAVTTFTSADAKMFLVKNGASEDYVKLFLHTLKAKGKINRLARGVYTYSDSIDVVGFAFSPFYYGLGYAMTLHGIWSQMANPTIITTTKALPGTRKIMGENVLIKRISSAMFFGYEYIFKNNIYVPVSTPEKVLIDTLYYGIKLNAEDLRALVNSVKIEKLSMYERLCEPRLFKRAKALVPL